MQLISTISHFYCVDALAMVMMGKCKYLAQIGAQQRFNPATRCLRPHAAVLHVRLSSNRSSKSSSSIEDNAVCTPNMYNPKHMQLVRRSRRRRRASVCMSCLTCHSTQAINARLHGLPVCRRGLGELDLIRLIICNTIFI
jgi:hypothetical protein